MNLCGRIRINAKQAALRLSIEPRNRVACSFHLTPSSDGKNIKILITKNSTKFVMKPYCMKTHQTSILFLSFVILMAFRCKKDVNPCVGLAPPTADFAIQEVFIDTAFSSDTVFRNNTINFTALRQYNSVLWKVGNDPRDFTTHSFNLFFPNFLGTIAVQFRGTGNANPLCFPGDSGIYNGTKRVTIVEQFDRATLTKSPLVGQYRGSFKTQPNDSFTIQIEYFDSAKYDISTMGSKNFYWISNIPRGYIDSTSEPARQYPELRNGMRPSMGYKSLVFGDYGAPSQGRGYGALVGRDTLNVYYKNVHTGIKIFTGRRI